MIGGSPARRWVRELASFAAAERRAAPDVLLAVLRHLDPDPPSLRLASLAGAGAERPDLVAAAAPAATVASPGPGLLGLVDQQLRSRADRRAAGAFYTPPEVAAGLVDLALVGTIGSGRPVIVDPAVGAGAFLVAAAEVARRSGADPDQLLAEGLHGRDVDPLAVAIAEAELGLWARRVGCRPSSVPGLEIGDGLDAAWRVGDGATLVVGNPPFLGQLGRGTVRADERRAELRQRFGDGVGVYTDDAGLFLLAALELAAPGGRVSLVLPQSLLSARDAAGVRGRAVELGEWRGVWFSSQAVFRAGTRVWAPVFERRPVRSGRRVHRRVGPSFDARPSVEFGDADGVVPVAGDVGTSWAPVVADLLGVPPVDPTGSTLAAWCSATAGFRDQFYGLAPHVGDEPTGAAPRLVTVAAIDAAHLRWGEHPVRFAGQRYVAPRLDLVGLAEVSPSLLAWVEARLVPKILVATQTSVIEAVVDETGDLVPSTPVIAVTGPADRLWHVLAVLLSPTATAWALRVATGSSLAPGSVKLAARQVLDVPMPDTSPSGAWDEAAAQVRAAQAAAGRGDNQAWAAGLRRAGRVMTAAYGAEESVYDWWVDRLPGWRR